MEVFRQKFPEHIKEDWTKAFRFYLFRHEHGDFFLNDFPWARSLFDRLIKKRFSGIYENKMPHDSAGAVRTLKHNKGRLVSSKVKKVQAFPNSSHDIILGFPM